MLTDSERARVVEAMARAVEDLKSAGVWSDDMRDVWWNSNPFFCEQVTSWGYFTGTRKQLELHHAQAALTAALPLIEEAVKPRVKELVWQDGGYGALLVLTAADYIIEDQGSNWTGGDRYWLFFGGLNAGNRIGKFAILDEAKAAAQADYARRILDALEGE